MPEFTVKQIKDYFGYTSLGDFAKDWKELPTKDREQIKTGLQNRSLTY